MMEQAKSVWKNTENIINLLLVNGIQQIDNSSHD